jgi:phage terminase large subunit
VSHAETIEALFRRYQSDPLAFCEDFFPDKERPREWQPEVLREAVEAQWVAVVACRKAGKTRLAAFLALWFLCTRANSLVITIAPVWLQVVQALWADIRHLWAVSKLPKVFPSWQVLQTEIQTHPLTPKWRAIGLASTDSANIEGRHPAAGQPTLAIIDEAFNVTDEFFTSLQGMLSEGDSKLVAIGRAGLPRGWYFEAFSSKSHLWGFTKRITADEIPRLAEKAAAERERLGENDPSYRQQWLAEFTGADDGALMPEADVNRAKLRAMPKSSTWKKIAALDVAGDSIGGTGDMNVLTFRHGPVILKQIPWSGRDEMETAAKTVGHLREFQPDIFVYDSVGIGAGVGSRIRELMKGTNTLVLKFNGGTSPRDKEQFANLKTEEAFYLRARFIAGEISIPDDPELVSQICSWTTKPTETGKTKLVDPADSPDKADSLLMAFAADRMGSSVVTMTPSFLR